MRGGTALFRPAVVAILSATLAVAVVVLSAAEDGFTKQVGGSFAGAGETLQLKLTVPVNPSVPMSVMVEVPDLPAAAISRLAGFDERLNWPTDGGAEGQSLTKLAAFTEPRPVAKS